MPDYVPADQVAALPDLVRPEVTDRMATLVVQGTTPGGLTMRTQELVRECGLTRSAGATGWGTWQIISTVNARITAGDWFVTRSGSPQVCINFKMVGQVLEKRGIAAAFAKSVADVCDTLAAATSRLAADHPRPTDEATAECFRPMDQVVQGSS